VSAIELKQVSKSYREPQSGAEVPVLENLDFSLERGESTAIVGPSGCGKSTLLNLIGTLDRCDTGTISLLGQDVTLISEKEAAPWRASKIGFIFQAHHLLPQLTVQENVLLPTLALPKQDRPSKQQAIDRARELLEAVGLSGRADFRPGQISGGERQRCAVVRALVNGPAILLADEPTGALDEKNAHGLADLLAQLQETAQLALVVVTHDADIARRMGTARTMQAGHLLP